MWRPRSKRRVKGKALTFNRDEWFFDYYERDENGIMCGTRTGIWYGSAATMA